MGIRLSVKEQLHPKVNAGKATAAGSGPSGMGMMQPRGAPNKVGKEHNQNGYMPRGRTHAAWEWCSHVGAPS